MDYENMPLTELKQIAKEKNVKNISKLKKEELITLLVDEKNTSIKEKNENNDSKNDDNVVDAEYEEK